MLENLPIALQWVDATSEHPAFLRLLDQRKLPSAVEYLECATSGQVCDAIAELAVRGAPAIGEAGAYAVALWVLNEWRVNARHACIDADNLNMLLVALESQARDIGQVRPTAVNLSWAVEGAIKAARAAAFETPTVEGVAQGVLAYSHKLMAEDEDCCKRIGLNGAAEFHELAVKLGRPLRVETHCNAGTLACARYGTALSIIYHAFEAGDIEKVWVDETRPINQGARLTAWELGQAGVPYTLICDNMAGSLMQKGQVDAVVVGADRICANGDFANKIGTYPLAVLAAYHHVPFYTAAPHSTFDGSLQSGEQIVIEQRAPYEVRCAPLAGGVWEPTAPQDADTYNPAFDVTPHELIAGIVHEEGIWRP